MGEHESTTTFTAAKAYVGAALAGLVAGLVSIQAALGDNVITSSEWVAAAVAALVGAGVTGGGVYATTNRPKD